MEMKAEFKELKQLRDKEEQDTNINDNNDLNNSSTNLMSKIRRTSDAVNTVGDKTNKPLIVPMFPRTLEELEMANLNSSRMSNDNLNSRKSSM